MGNDSIHRRKRDRSKRCSHKNKVIFTKGEANHLTKNGLRENSDLVKLEYRNKWLKLIKNENL
jgi:hypothetical protein